MLWGRVRDIQYREISGSDYAVYSVSYSGVNSKIDLTDRTVSVEPEIDRYHQAGDEYAVPAGSFHQTFLERKESALTLVAICNFKSAKPLVLGEAAGQSFPYDRIEFDRTHFWSVVEHAVTHFARPCRS